MGVQPARWNQHSLAALYNSGNMHYRGTQSCMCGFVCWAKDCMMHMSTMQARGLSVYLSLWLFPTHNFMGDTACFNDQRP